MKKIGLLRWVVLFMICCVIMGGPCSTIIEDPDAFEQIEEELPVCTFGTEQNVSFYPVELKTAECDDIFRFDEYQMMYNMYNGIEELWQVFEFADYKGTGRDEAEITWHVVAEGCKEGSEDSYSIPFTWDEPPVYSNSLGYQKTIAGVVFTAQTITLTIKIKDCHNVNTGEIGTLIWTRDFSNVGSFTGLDLGNCVANFESENYKTSRPIFVHDEYLEFY